jgi:hypothetical protein
MSGKRFDKYIPLFGRADDKRVALFLNDIQDQSDKARGSGAHTTVSVKMSGKSLGMQNRFYIKKDDAFDDAVHSEYKQFVYQLAKRLSNKTVTDRAQLDIVKSLANASLKPGSVEEFISAVLSAIAEFSTSDGSGSGNDFLKNNTDLSKVDAIKFKSLDDIVKNLTNNIVIADVSTVDKQAQGVFEHDLDPLVYATTAWNNATAGEADEARAELITKIKANSLYRNTFINLFNNKTALPDATVASGTKATDITAVYTALLKMLSDNDTAREFGYKYDDYFVKMFLKAAEESVVPVAPRVPAMWTDSVPPTSQQVFVRELDGTLMVREGDNMVPLSKSKMQAALKVDNKCMTTGAEQKGTYKDASGTAQNVTCADYLRDCLGGKDATQCKNFLQSYDFWANAVKEVDNMHPSMIEHTLKAFQFNFQKIWDDEAGQQLVKVMSVEDWTNSLLEQTKAVPATLTEAEYKAIIGNEKLIGYLRMLVNKLNNNPALLNKNYRGGLKPSASVNQDAFRESRLYKFGIRPRMEVDPFGVVATERLGQAIRASTDGIKLSVGMPGLYGYSASWTLKGGADALELAQERVEKVNKQTWSLLEQHYNGLLNRLKQHKKTIDERDDKLIRAEIEKLKDAEQKLNKAILYTEQYAKLVEVYGQKDNSSVLDLNHLKNFVDAKKKYLERVSKKQSDLISIIKSIAEAVKKETPEEPEYKAEKVDPKSVGIRF